jgi:hypothetical protein
MQKIQLYIQGERVDMFEDESVTITQTIQNIKDISKVFTDFSRTFSVPASKTNNKIFRHYYNFDIVNGFDARTKKSANIELNNTPFRTGKIKLEGVDLKNNQPHTYRVTFFGSTVTLKDLLGEDKLNDLVSLSQYDLGYSPASVKGKLESPPSSTNHVIAPLITHTQRLYYDSTTGNDEADSGDLHYFNNSGSQYVHGVKWNELKYALRVNKIIEAIEFDYGLEFSSDFFKNTNVDEFNNLFLWLHRKSGAVEDLSGVENVTYSKLINSFAPTGTFIPNINNNGTTVGLFVYNQGGATPVTDSTVTVSSTSGVTYNVVVRLNGSTYQTETGKVNNYTFDLNNMPNGTWTITLETEAANSFTDVSWAFSSVQNEGSYTGTLTSSSINIDAIFVFNISKQMPEIKIIDFLSGLFRTFNLTAYIENDIIKVETLDSFYESGKGADNTTEAYDITKYIDVDTTSVDVPLIYNDILFKFKDTKTFLANKFGEIQNRAWGESTAIIENNEIKLSGSQYKIEVPFGKMLFERLTNQANVFNKETFIQWGWNVDKSQNAYLGSPLLFYPINTTTIISFVDQVNSDNVATSHTSVSSVNMPFNSVSKVPATDASQLSFFNEISEWTLNSDFDGTLYNDYYDKYITNIFDISSRLIKVTAYLPLRILVNYNLSDRFVISGNKYKINSITTNLDTGKSEIELLNDI